MKSLYQPIKDVRIVNLLDTICKDVAELPELSNSFSTDLRIKLESIEYGAVNAEFAIAYRQLIGKHSSTVWTTLRVNSEHFISLVLKHAFRLATGQDDPEQVPVDSLSDIVHRNFKLIRVEGRQPAHC